MKIIACTLGLTLLIAGCGEQDSQMKNANNAGGGATSPDTTSTAVTTSSTAAPNATNSAINERDKGHPTVTALDQGSSETDRTLTANIRKDVIADKSLSMDAHNVKIITINGMVTLRGAVDSVTERDRIGDLAAKEAGAGKVDNQLDTANRK
jgi:osmotically-inducible protein OsmY